MAHEVQGLRLSGSLYIFRKTLTGEETAMGPLAAQALTMQPNVETNDITDKRRDRRGQVLYSVSDAQSTTGSVTLLSVSQRAIAMNLMGDVTTVTTPAGSVTGESIYLEPDYSAQLEHKNILNVVVESGVQASLDTGVVGDDNALTWTASGRYAGVAGNAIRVALVDPDAADQPLSIVVDGTDITVNLATDNLEDIATTAADLIAAIAGNMDASALVTVANTGSSTGATDVTAVTQTALSGGADTGGTVYAIDDDYSIDHRLGVVRALQGGSIPAGSVFVNYDYRATTATRVSPSTTSTVRARLLLTGTNDIDGSDVEFEAYSVMMTPSGEIDILNDEPVNLEFAMTYETPSGQRSPIRYDVITYS